MSGFFNSTDEPGFYAPGAPASRRVRRCRGPTRRPTRRSRRPRRSGPRRRGRMALRARWRLRRPWPTGRRAGARQRKSLPPCGSRSQHALVAHYPFEETDAGPGRPAAEVEAERRRPAPPPLAPETRGRGGFCAAPRRRRPRHARARRPHWRGTAAGRAAGAHAAGGPRARLRCASVAGGHCRVSTPALLEAPLLKDGVKGKAFFFDDNNRGILGDGVGDYERTQPFSIDLWVLPNQVYEDATVFNHREDNNTGNAGYQLQLDKNQLQFDLQHSRAGNMIRVVTREPPAPEAVVARHHHLRRVEPGGGRRALRERRARRRPTSSATT